MNTHLLNRYAQQQKEINQLMLDIQKKIKKHSTAFKKNPNYGYLGDINHIVEVLEDLDASLT